MKITIPQILKMKSDGEKITMLTAYDYPFARILDRAGVDILLVGDSLGMVFAGHPNTLPVRVDDLIYHTQAVSRGVKNALIVADMPFMSYQVSIEEAKRNCGRAVKEGGAEAVKLEGGVTMQDTISALTDIDIPVMGHVGLTPQSIHRMGGYRVQGREKRQWKRIVQDAKAVEAAGAFAVVLEGVPLELAREITSSLKIPTIGIGAGVHCDGQVLVIHDLLGLSPEPVPTFVRRYADIGASIREACSRFVADVRAGTFPSEKESYHLKPEALAELESKLDSGRRRWKS